MTHLTLIGQKANQMQNFLQNGKRIPVTEIFVSENVVMQVKNADTHSYSAIQLGTGVKKRANKALLGHAKKANRDTAPSKIKEVRVSQDEMPTAGDIMTVEASFKPGDIVQITGTSKGKGFAGVVRRYNFRGGPKTHGQSDRHRAPGSIGQTTTPGRVYKGKRMAGRMGSDTVTVRNLTVVDVDAENQKLYVSGLIPGHRNGWVFITRTGEDKNFVPLLSTEEEKAPVEESVKSQTHETPEAVEVEEVKEGTETVAVAEEVVKTAPEVVETADETVAVPAEAASEDVKVEEPKDVDADSSSEQKEENAG